MVSQKMAPLSSFSWKPCNSKFTNCQDSQLNYQEKSRNPFKIETKHEKSISSQVQENLESAPDQSINEVGIKIEFDFVTTNKCQN